MNWTIAAAIAGPAMALVGVVAAALIGRAHGRKQAEAAISQAETADWAAYSSELRQDRDEAHRQVRTMQGDIRQLSVRVDAAEKRSESAEKRSAVAEERADAADTRYRAAAAYIQQLFEWLSHRVPGESPPPPPPELAGHL
ncbi:hypothetical protein [Mycobacteroides abscessus]|uniref:hypothetical protein n=2 Tax=Mycobacteroides TaxID=670516 RepID=UPI0009A87B85|nr:hypothetical protein [Mycobacteroides abscessus]RIT69201.1 hypothetical protein D2E87_01220 [Mycobacteroides abscessus]